MNIYDLLMAIYNRIDLEFFGRSGDNVKLLDKMAYRTMLAFRDNENVSAEAKKLLENYWPKDDEAWETGKYKRSCLDFINEVIRQSSRELLDEAILKRPHEAEAENWEGIWLKLHEE